MSYDPGVADVDPRVSALLDMLRTLTPAAWEALDADLEQLGDETLADLVDTLEGAGKALTAVNEAVAFSKRSR